MKKIVVVGSTGSVGTQALDVVRRYPDKMKICALAANKSVDLLVQQAREFLPDVAVIVDESKYKQLKEGLRNLPVKIFAGAEAVLQIVEDRSASVVLMATVGFSGLGPTISAIKAGKVVALANKEVLVLAGELITQLAIKHRALLLPVDSEHSAIFQCLVGEKANMIERLILTASGGPFRTYSLDELNHVTKKEALKHPNWAMGDKITIDSATLMNKGLEIIEAKWLFGVCPEQMEVLIHPQSIVHSMVQFKDKSVKAQLGVPDMRLPIQYALTFPDRLQSTDEPLNLEKYSQLTFERPDTVRFPHLHLALEAVRQGGNIPCVLNAANEVVVNAFLRDRIPFLAMSHIVEKAIHSAERIVLPSYEDLVATDQEVRAITSEIIEKTM